MDELIQILTESGLSFAYDHFAEGESPEPPFVCYLLPGSDNFAADGAVYYKISEVHIELYTDCKDLSVERQLEESCDGSFLWRMQDTHMTEAEREDFLADFEKERKVPFVGLCVLGRCILQIIRRRY